MKLRCIQLGLVSPGFLLYPEEPEEGGDGDVTWKYTQAYKGSYSRKAFELLSLKHNLQNLEIMFFDDESKMMLEIFLDRGMKSVLI